ncbi:MAG: T9SS type A sorting domain-containing protein [Bacteroidia bacterium]
MNTKINHCLGYLCLGLMGLYGVPAHSQSLNDAIHATYAGFDSTQLSTPFLLNRSLNASNLEKYEVEIDSTPNTTLDWFQSYMDLYSCQYAPTTGGKLPHNPSTILRNMDEYRRNGLHPIGLLAKYANLIPDSSFENETIPFDSINTVFDFSGFDYTLDEKFIFTTAVLVPIVEGNSLNLILEEDFVFTDDALDSVYVSIPALGLVRKMNPHTILPIDVSELGSTGSGDFTIYLEILTKNKWYRRGIRMKRIPPVPAPDETIHNFYVPNACSFNAPKGFGEAEVYVLYSNQVKKANLTITRPLILVEGYDPSNMDYGSIKWGTFSTGKSYNEFGEEVYQQLLLMPQLLAQLTALDYDIVIVNFKTSSLNLETNAATLAKIIQWTKYRTQGNEGVTLMGASMGGIVSQIAMNLLDKSDCKTCVETFVSFDAPYHGANIPMGIQESAKYFYDNLAKARVQYEFKLNVPAAKELLYEHVNQNTERQAWLTTFGQMNKKLATFNVCLASSAKSSILNGISNGDELMFFKVRSKIGNKTFTDFHVYSANRSDHLVMSAKFPTSYVGGIPRYFASKNAFYFPNSYNYDGLPGSVSNFIGDMYDELDKEAANLKFRNLLDIDGPGMPIGRNHSFVPTISAMDYSTNDPLVNLINVDWEIPHLSRPFDMVYFASQNDFHVLISNEQINNLVQILDQKIISYTDLSILPYSSFNIFNFGQRDFSSFGSISIHSGGQLNFNNAILVNYGNVVTDPLADISKIYARSSSCNAHVNCEANGAIILGGTKPNGDQLTAQVEFRKGSILELQSDAVLRVRDGSTLIIDEGALFIIHPGAQIILEGENAVLELRGKVRLENDAVLSFTKGAAAKGGFVRFNYKEVASDHFELMGPNCKINLTGETYFADKIVEIEGTTKLILPNFSIPSGLQLAEFKLKDGVVAYTGNGSINAYCPIRFENTDFEQVGDQVATAVVTHGQASLIIEDCIFNSLALGIEALNNDLGSDFLIKNNRFFQCATGVETYGRKTTLDGNEFSNCGFGLFMDGTTDVVLQGTDFIYNFVGLETSGTNPHVRAEGCWFLRNEYGISDFNETKFTFTCTPFEQNTVGVYTNGKVNMSPSYVFPGQTLGGENNTFFQNQTALQLNLAEIHLVDGQNNFTIGTSRQVPNYLMGSLVNSPLYLANNILDVSGNYFDNLPAGGISAGNGLLYNLLAFGGSGINGAVVTLNGALLNSLNTACFSLIRNYPDNKAELDLDPEEYDHSGHARLEELKAYPNPTEDIVMLEGKTETVSNRTILIYDLSGKEIHRTNWTLLPGLNRTQLNLRELADPGVYLIKILDESGDYQVVKISLTY